MSFLRRRDFVDISDDDSLDTPVPAAPPRRKTLTDRVMDADFALSRQPPFNARGGRNNRFGKPHQPYCSDDDDLDRRPSRGTQDLVRNAPRVGMPRSHLDAMEDKDAAELQPADEENGRRPLHDSFSSSSLSRTGSGRSSGHQLVRDNESDGLGVQSSGPRRFDGGNHPLGVFQPPSSLRSRASGAQLGGARRPGGQHRPMGPPSQLEGPMDGEDAAAVIESSYTGFGNLNMPLSLPTRPPPGRSSQLIAPMPSSTVTLPQIAPMQLPDAALPAGSDVPAQSGVDFVELDEEPPPVVLPKGVFRYDKAWQQNSLMVVMLAWQHLKQLGHKLCIDLRESDWRLLCLSILHSMPIGVKHTLMRGSVDTHFRSDAFQSRLERPTSRPSHWMRESKKDAPMIYAISLTDENGRSPTSNELRQIIPVARRYAQVGLDFVDDAVEIDNILRENADKRSTRDHLMADLPFFLTRTENNIRRRVQGRIDTLLRFCDELERRLNKVPVEAQDLPWYRALLYIGYAFNFANRQKQHASGSTNWLMHLVHSICFWLFGAKYSLKNSPICFMAEHAEVKVAETLLTLVSDSFARSGGGFNIAMPGLSNAGADMTDKTTDFVNNFWSQRVDFRVKMEYWNTDEVNAEVKAIIASAEPDQPASLDVPNTQRGLLSTAKARIETVTAEVFRLTNALLAEDAEVVRELKSLE
ncbi:hypothetical protein CC80DRAFT_490019 [Byssothecium circinans]|uniref:Uncharacterized protein n=1 Tax=Byssothecium circinans TaxID=147558 RepID=A0A6A5U506_9PLEO|nr:hypothetical protein CC80DRAFT_490019 [Byssothecium circinans]